MKKVYVACGAGLATSSMVKARVEEMLKDNGISANVQTTTLNELINYDDGDADIFITTMKVDDSKYKTPTVQGSAYLTGLNTGPVDERVLKILK
ncbi:PTS sugar transporter subunit IIB [Aerococcus tenax]|uniref:PTS sugar transporter subunit IIB n=1 Tax=Aerococcus tenax TaxID=3078812 RepID=UPI0018A7936A|nr:PTS sugar transporter subunit IIB [Aerococcus tenax]